MERPARLKAVAYYHHDGTLSVSQQAAACGRMADQLNVSIVEEFGDAGPSRIELQRLLDRIRRFPVAYVIIQDFDRLGTGTARRAWQDAILSSGIKVAVAERNCVIEVMVSLGKAAA